ncbi:hypothetical protein OGATHE_002868 [Ogataea polymorpha]|uniref:Uncharacterized protein n=1 Tax=Ogataea polymorpha TaxID=460523 RepID=A0A9P8T998_9ASCO|nr:hypothetical protein OGATHE_002868 [Ogataea polymorpha]
MTPLLSRARMVPQSCFWSLSSGLFTETVALPPELCTWTNSGNTRSIFPLGPFTVTTLSSLRDLAPLGTNFGTSRSMNSNSTCGGITTGDEPM